MSISALMKCTTAIRQFAYGSTADAFDEYLQMISCKVNTVGVIKKYPTIMLEAVASQELWISHAFYGIAGANNDINVLDNSSLFDDLLDDLAHVVPYVVNGVEYRNGYYLTDGIYLEWASFVKSFTVATGPKHTLDVSNPLHLHPNDSTALTIVFVILKGTKNYQDRVDAASLGNCDAFSRLCKQFVKPLRCRVVILSVSSSNEPKSRVYPPKAFQVLKTQKELLTRGWLLEEIHVTWAHLKKKRTRLQLYTKPLEEYAYSAWRRRHGLQRTASEFLRRHQDPIDLKKP
nr:hypothetical protein [Tanacetum cinerariifolium]